MSTLKFPVFLAFSLFVLALGSSERVVATSKTCSESYHQPGKFLANPDESLLIAGVMGWVQKNKHILIWDENYATVARKWSQYLMEEDLDSQRMLQSDRILFELKLLGTTDATIGPFSVSGPAEKIPPELLQFLNEEAARGRYSHFGIGVFRSKNQQTMLSTLLLGRKPLLLDPVPVCPAPNTRLPLRARLLKGYHHPTWLMTQPDGSVARGQLLYEEGAFHAEVPLDGGVGTYQMEIVVRGPAGPEVGALFPLYVNVPRALVPSVKLQKAPKRYRSPQEAEQALLALIAQTRSQQKLPPLKHNEKLSDIAREHSMQLLVERHASHHTQATGSLMDRLRKQSVPFTKALENVALSHSPEGAHLRFLESPGHRLNVLDAAVTEIGVGIAMERSSLDDILAVTEIYLEAPNSEDSQVVIQRIVKMINQTRLSRGRFALGLDQELSQHAQRSARRLVASGDRADPQQEGERLLLDIADQELGLLEVEMRYYKTHNLKQLLTAKEVLGEKFNRLGIGVSPLAHPQTPGTYWIAILFAAR